jgi:hypothetical protein
MNAFVGELSQRLGLDGLLAPVSERCGPYDLLDHWQQGEFHHDLVVRVAAKPHLPGEILLVATNCNGGVKEILNFDQMPDRWALWHHRCPDNPEFAGILPPILSKARTPHYFDPCELLLDNARSELRPSCRRWSRGGGWEPI